MKKISPSLLSANFSNLEKDIKMLEEGGAHLLHIDVMDGHFVPNITMGPVIVEAINKVAKIPLDVHLMIENPGNYVDAFIDAGADYLTVHAEAAPHLHRVIQKIKARGVKAGVSLNPHTPISVLENVLNDIDLVLIMSVNPGFGGQSFIPNTIEKLRGLQIMLKKHNAGHVEVEVDGGIKIDNIKEVSEAGCDIFVSGSGIFKAKNPIQMIKDMTEVLSSYTLNG
ncbi:MAG: ribulose-phosphate 3-epimerase [Bacteroidetes bacterium 4572_117]|nr:MAG: ribulose-phosphate 3-epimerase [Bacteroidetes bacterium 4572_117]